MNSRFLALMLIAAMTCPPATALAQPSTSTLSEGWTKYIASIPVGTRVRVELADGRRMQAVMMGVEGTEVLLQPRGRLPEPVQRLPLDSVRAIERRENGGVNAGKAILIGAVSGVAAFLGLLAFAFAVAD
jgi:hypothetical protein